MPFYQKRGKIPPTRHTQMRDENGNLYYEELVSRKGFSGIYSNIYHKNPPTGIKKTGKLSPIVMEIWKPGKRPHHFETAKLKNDGDALSSRIPLMGNSDLIIHRANITNSMDLYSRNAHFDEMWYVSSGSGTLFTNFGSLMIGKGDYVVIPRGTIWTFKVEKPLIALIVETAGPIETPNNYRNHFGQLMEHSPFCERDINTPSFPIEQSPLKDNIVRVRFNEGYQDFEYKHSPFDLIGWDGYYFPWSFNIKDFQPITGKVHQPPPVHQTFQAPGLVVCSFVPRLFDYHDQAIPAPYAHSNVDSDEVLFYVEGNFMSRKGIGQNSITLHPMGMPHGPQPGKLEESIGAKETNEVAVMIDTFKPLDIYRPSSEIDDPSYQYSWIKE